MDRTAEPAAQPTAEPAVRVIDVLRRYNLDYVRRYRRTQACPRVQSVLAKIELCRTAALGGHKYQCPGCGECCEMYNSCTERHCPQCRGAKPLDWLETTESLLLAGVPYFHVVFTLPDTLNPLTLGNRHEIYGLLFRSAGAALQELMAEELGVETAAVMVLHTWNQELDHHPHLHVLVLGGGPSLDGTRWIDCPRRWSQGRQQPFLVDNVELGRRFRQKFAAGLKHLHDRGKIRYSPPPLPDDPYETFAEWVDYECEGAWNVFIKGPPTDNADPADVLKYLGQYLAGGPISDARLISDEDGVVTFWARPKGQTGEDELKDDGLRKPRPFFLPGREFVRRWAMHILPKGFIRTRFYGGYSYTKRTAYLDLCRRLRKLDIVEDVAATANSPPEKQEAEEPEDPAPKCPRCGVVMVSRGHTRRRSWREIFTTHATCPVWYVMPEPTFRPPRKRGPPENPTA